MPSDANHTALDENSLNNTSCPPDDERSIRRRHGRHSTSDELIESTTSLYQQLTPPPTDLQLPGPAEAASITDERNIKSIDIDEETNAGPDMMSPMSADSDSKPEENELPALTDPELTPPPMGYDFSNIRLIQPSSSSFLRSGSKFHGTQQSERQVYDVQVEIKNVDMRESFLCGYLRIQGLTEDHPTLTTYFEGEIIGSKYSFLTQHQDWGSSDKTDLIHWAKFSAFGPFHKSARKGHLHIPGLTQRENIFMRWKEHFLVPDHRVRTISGASFEGFYYICFNQIQGTVKGIYFHAKSEKFQQLELKHVEDRGCFPAVEFR